MAVTVQKTPFVVLDEDGSNRRGRSLCRSQFGPLVGSLIWDCFPGSEPLFKPYYDAARRSGEELEFVQFYDGNVARIHAVPQSNGHLDLWTGSCSRTSTRLTLTRPSCRRSTSRSSSWTKSTSAYAEVALRQNLRLIEGERHELAGRRRAATRRSRRIHRARRRRSHHARVGAISTTTSDAGSGTSSGSTSPARGTSTDRRSTRHARPVARWSRVVFYSGRVKRLTVIPGPDGLAVHVERLAQLDVTTLATLTASLAQIEAALAGRASAQPDSPARASLRALP